MFELKESKKIELLDVNAQVYKHSKFNTQHIHLDADNDEKVFMVAFRTIPEDSTGVAHILEHTSLCGSAKYPVRDPFFMMIRRSLNSFMNAFIHSKTGLSEIEISQINEKRVSPGPLIPIF